MKRILIAFFFCFGSLLIKAQDIRTYSSPGNAEIYPGAVAAVSDGNVFSDRLKYASGFSKTRIIKTDFNGVVQWEKIDDSGEIYTIVDIAEDNAKNLFFLCDDSTGYDHYSLIKTNAAGTILWGKRISKNGLTSYDNPVLKCDALGNSYVLSCLSEAAFVYKIDSSGTLAWSRCIVPDLFTSKNPSFDMVISSDGSLVICGKAELDAYFCKIAFDGTLLWFKRLNDFNNSLVIPTCITELTTGQYLVAGYRSELVAPYLSGMFMLKMDLSGNIDDFRFYSDSSSYYNFIPSIVYSHPDGGFRVVGKGGYLFVADFDAALQLTDYHYWPVEWNIKSNHGSYDMNNNRLLASFTSVDSAGYIMSLPSGFEGICNWLTYDYISSFEIIPDSVLYTSDVEYTFGPTIVDQGFVLDDELNFNSSVYCLYSSPLATENEFMVPTASSYPNPVLSGEKVTVDFNGVGVDRLSVYSANGTLLYSMEKLSGIESVSLSGMHSGLYFIRIESEVNAIVLKQVVR